MNNIAKVDRKMARRCETPGFVLLLDNTRARFTKSPPKPWHMKTIGRCPTLSSGCLCESSSAMRFVARSKMPFDIPPPPGTV